MKNVIILALAVAASGCDRMDQASAKTENSDAYAADNTKRNERDRNSATLTPGDQGGSEADRTITQNIRQNVVKADALSMTGKNVKIITVNGVVTLRGPVNTAEEKAVIAGIAQGVAGVQRIDNQLEIATN